MVPAYEMTSGIVKYFGSQFPIVSLVPIIGNQDVKSKHQSTIVVVLFERSDVNDVDVSCVETEYTVAQK